MESKSPKQPCNKPSKQNRHQTTQGGLDDPEHDAAAVPEIMNAIADLFEKISEKNNRIVFTEEKELTLLESISGALKSQSEARPRLTDRMEQVAPANTVRSKRTRQTASDPVSRNHLAEIILAMRKTNATYKEIARKLNEENQPTLSGRGKWHPASVEKLSPGKSADFQACRKQVMQIISDMRQRNATYKEIADKLNQDKQPTFSGRGKWYPATIKQLYPDRNLDYQARRKKIDQKYDRQQVIEIISGMRERDATYKEIAEKLNEEKHPTFSGRGKWHPASIEKLYPGRRIDRHARKAKRKNSKSDA